MQIQITQIDNGYLVAEGGEKRQLPNGQVAVVREQTVNYAENFQAVVATLQSMWPKEQAQPTLFTP